MYSQNYEQNTVHDIVEHVPEASHVLRSYHVDVTASQDMTMEEVARTVTAQTDEMLAVMEYRARRAAQASH